jgi:hypothetical protein
MLLPRSCCCTVLLPLPQAKAAKHRAEQERQQAIEQQREREAAQLQVGVWLRCRSCCGHWDSVGLSVLGWSGAKACARLNGAEQNPSDGGTWRVGLQDYASRSSVSI